VRLLFDGHLAVCIFFVLSGDALSTAFLQSGRYSILTKMAIKRYFRLAGPILVSSLLVYLLLYCGLTFNHEAASISHNQSWLGSFLNFEANLIDAIKFGLRFAFSNANSPNSYNTFLWPMGIELLGSFGLFLYLALQGNLKYPMTTLVLATIAFTAARQYFGLFCVGVIFSQLRNAGFFETVFKSKAGKRWFVLGIIFWLLLYIAPSILSERVFQMDAILASLFIFLVYGQEKGISFFSNQVSRFLGKISFPLYITHFGVIVSFTSWLIVLLDGHNSLNLANSFLIILSSAVVAILIADLFSRLELRYLRFLDRLASLLIK
jgi:peptidoglycan/LPS O-acetylase OafA/YrhL